MSVPTCTGEPLSWLRLERHRLAELSLEESRAVEAHLATCAACAVCASDLNRPIVLSPLPVPGADASVTGARPRRGGPLLDLVLGVFPGFFLGSRSDRKAPRLIFGGGAVVAIVAVAVVASVGVGRGRLPPGLRTEEPIAVAGHEPRLASKGGDVAIELVRDRLGVIEHDATRFAPGDSWKLLVTCPAERLLFWDLTVVDGGRASFPLSPSAPIACGNHVALPGAFRLSATTPVDVCLFLADNPLDRGRLGGAGHRVCARLHPVGAVVPP